MHNVLWFIFLALLSFLTACSSSVPAKPTPSSPLECEAQKYPCSYAKVSLAVLQKSLNLSDEAAKKLGAGTPIQEVVAFLRAQPGMAEVLSDGSALRFRLEGGRPMAIDPDIDTQMLPSPPVAKRPVVQSVRAQEVVGVYGQKRALVLSPFRYEFGGKVGEKVAALLETVPGYKGNVTYIYTDDEHDPQVTVDVLSKMADYDVIHLDTHGGSLCITKNQSLSAQSGSNCDGGITDILIQRFHGTAEDLQSLNHPGVIHYRGKKHQSIAVTADFFRHYYPGGLDNAVFILASCNTFRSDFAQAIAGSSSIFFSWDQTVSEARALDASVKLMQALGKGLTTTQALSSLQGQGQDGDPTADARLLSSYRKAGGDLRIRELLSVKDSLTGKEVTHSSGIEIIGTPGDGKNDGLKLLFTVDGVESDQLNMFNINLVVNDKVIGHINLAEAKATRVGDYRYQVITSIQLPFDAKEGQPLKLDFWIPLPDLGRSYFRASPTVNKKEAFASEWRLTSTATYSGTDDSITKTANVIFELEPGQNPQSRYLYYRVKSGTLQYTRQYKDALNCAFSISTTIDIAPGEANNTLEFDMGGTPVLDGLGNAKGKTVQVTGNCPSGDPTSASIKVGGVYFIADNVLVSGSSASGSYSDGAQRPTVIQWTLTKIR